MSPLPATRYDDRRRTFPALGARSERTGTWWGGAWIEALEGLALDPARLARGRRYAQAGNVDAITVTPGRITAYVHGSRPRPYRTELRLRTLPDAAWEDFLDTAAQNPSHIAALLDKDLPHTLADQVDLLPASGDLVPDCSCPDDGYPCKHAAALCYQTARLLDEDPFVLLLMRGRGEQETLAALARRNTALSAVERETPAPELPTVAAREAVRAGARPELPPPLPARHRAGQIGGGPAGGPGQRGVQRPGRGGHAGAGVRRREADRVLPGRQGRDRVLASGQQGVRPGRRLGGEQVERQRVGGALEGGEGRRVARARRGRQGGRQLGPRPGPDRLPGGDRGQFGRRRLPLHRRQGGVAAGQRGERLLLAPAAHQQQDEGV
ncbi:SWIM zinc finger family protein, partial [Streptomyces sp. YS-3]|uniref:SWIM zinc finger family protein n=1 Tax=Streptomyces sp. YS-3 TaxID=3381352 RepID=UPI0038626E0E